MLNRVHVSSSCLRGWGGVVPISSSGLWVLLSCLCRRSWGGLEAADQMVFGPSYNRLVKVKFK